MAIASRQPLPWSPERLHAVVSSAVMRLSEPIVFPYMWYLKETVETREEAHADPSYASL